MDDAFFEALAKRVRVAGAEYVGFDELQGWPPDDVARGTDDGVLREIEPGTGLLCDQCGEEHFVEPERRTNPDTREAVGVYFCRDPEEGGRHTIALERLRRWEIVKDKLIELGYMKKPEKTLKETGKPLNVRVANAVIKHQNANSEDIARMVDSTPGSVRTTDAWKMRKQLRQRYDTKKGWKDSEGSMDAYSEEIQPEHWDIYHMFQDYKSAKNPDYPSIKRIAEKLDVTPDRAKTLQKEAQSRLGFSPDHMD